MIRLAVIVACAALLLTQPAGAATSTTIRWKNGRITQIGALKTWVTPTLERATAAFGAPTKMRFSTNSACRVDWTPLGLRGIFANFGGPQPGTTTCSTTVGKLRTAQIRGARLRTQAGLRVGDTLARLRELHPAAQRHGATWWLATAPIIYGELGSGRFPIVRANVRAGKVSALVLWISPGGE
jgi:hypothetical protein